MVFSLSACKDTVGDIGNLVDLVAGAGTSLDYINTCNVVLPVDDLTSITNQKALDDGASSQCDHHV